MYTSPLIFLSSISDEKYLKEIVDHCSGALKNGETEKEEIFKIMLMDEIGHE